jgi:hypothetical protein
MRDNYEDYLTRGRVDWPGTAHPAGGLGATVWSRLCTLCTDTGQRQVYEVLTSKERQGKTDDVVAQ